MPTDSTMTAASAGPKIREPVITAVLRAVALEMSSRFDELDDEPAAGRIVEGIEHTQHDRQAPHQPYARGAEQVDQPEQEGLGGEAGLGQDGERALVASVGDRPGPRPQQQHRQELQGQGDAEVGGPPGEPVDEQRHRGELQPRPDVRDEHAGEEQAGRCSDAGSGTSRTDASSVRRDRPDRAVPTGQNAVAVQSSSRRAEMNTSPGTSTRPIDFIFFLPSFCRSRSLRLRVMSPP